MIIEKKLAELSVGHYVVKIAKQQKNYSLSSSGHIKSNAVINHLKSKLVESVFIDDSKTKTNNDKNNNVKSDQKSSLSSQTELFIEELKNAKEIFDESKNIQKEVFASALSGAPLDLAPVIEVTNKSVEAVFNNPDSLTCMLNIREKDEYLLEHSIAVAVYIALFARHLEIEKNIIEELSIGAFLHDVGKIMIPDEILNKPGKLTDEEFTIMKSHANHSIDIIKKTPGIPPLSLEIAALHHEKLDGTGYPFNVKAENINRYGRMIAICDIFDALTATRVYKEGYPHGKAFFILRELAKQNHLDVTLVDQFIKCIGVYPIGSLVQLSSKKLAIVEKRNDNDPVNPVVRSFYNIKLKNFLKAKNLNLTDTEEFIEKGVRAEEFDLDMKQIIEMLSMSG